jgi:hypothetical protein
VEGFVQYGTERYLHCEHFCEGHKSSSVTCGEIAQVIARKSLNKCGNCVQKLVYGCKVNVSGGRAGESGEELQWSREQQVVE